MPPANRVLSRGMTTLKYPYVAPKGRQTYQLARALRIMQGRHEGSTFEALARQHGVTVTRIQQIYWQAVRRGWPKSHTNEMPILKDTTIYHRTMNQQE